MLVILIRHGAAASDSPLGDEGRALTPVGRRQAEATGRALADHAIQPTEVWTSPLVRAVQTAELVVGALFRDTRYAGTIEARHDLYSDSQPDSLVTALDRRNSDNPDATIVVVGHNPFMSMTAGLLLGCAVSGFTTGTAYAIRLIGQPPFAGKLEWRWPS